MRVDVASGADAGLAWHFGDPLGEQRAMESGTAAVALTNREVFTVSGEQRLTWLHSLTSQALGSLSPGQGADALLLSPNGHIEHGFALIDDGATAWCWTEPGARAGLLGWLDSMKFWTPVELVAKDDVQLWWMGAGLGDPVGSVASRPSAIGRGREVLVDETPETGLPAGQWAHEALRIAAGVPRIGIDTDTKTLPNEIGLFGTALDKGCYRGQETVARVHNLGRPPRRLVLLLFDGNLPEVGAAVIDDDRGVGILSSVAQHHELGPIGLALVKRSVPVAATLAAGGIAASQEVLVDPEVGEHFRPRL